MKEVLDILDIPCEDFDGDLNLLLESLMSESFTEIATRSL